MNKLLLIAILALIALLMFFEIKPIEDKSESLPSKDETAVKKQEK